MKSLFYTPTLIAFLAIQSCHKDKVTTSNNGSTPQQTPATGTTLDLVKDSVYLYTKEDYLWHSAIPDYNTFNPRSFTGSDDVTAVQKEVDALSQYAINPTTGKPYEYYEPSPGEAKYSFIDAGEESSRLQAVTGDFGFGLVYIGTNDLRVKYVYPNSPAANAGLKRGDQITSINGRSGSSISYDNGTNVNYVLNAYSNSSTITLTLKHVNGVTYNVTLNTSTYTVQPVITYKVIDAGNGHKIGYMVFNSFTSLATATSGLTAAFGAFSSANVTDLVVDLRYNGGGYVSTAEYIDNVIAPQSANGKLMYNTYYTDNLVNHTAPLLKHQVRQDANGKDYTLADVDYSVDANKVLFSKSGVPSLNALTRVFFIVTGSTASASELTINNLRPIMDVKLIGSTTYGKPVGFFDIDINKYQLFIPEFSTKNSAGQGDYYAGLTPGTDIPGVVDDDDVTKDFGDPTETLLAHAINYVKSGTFSLSRQVQSLSKPDMLSIQEANRVGVKLRPNRFMGMVLDKPLKHR